MIRSQKQAEARASKAEARSLQAEARSLTLGDQCTRLEERLLQLEAEMVAARASFDKFVQHLKDHEVQVPDTYGRLWQEGMWQVKEWGKRCDKCMLGGHWRQQCPVP